MADAPFRLEADGGVARLTLTRPEVHNAFDESLIAGLTEALEAVAADRSLRALVLAAEGRSFSAGADLTWMQRMAGYTREQNLEDARGLARLMATLDGLPKPTLALVQGAAYGGGVGLVACCDIAVAAEGAKFALTEVKLGLIPAVISPYVIAKIGAAAARRYFVTAERFDAGRAQALGLVQEVVAPEALEESGAAILAALAAGGPDSQAAAKDLVRSLAGRPIDGGVIEETAARIAEVRAGAEAREGIAAFLEKRKPAWVREP